MTEQTSSLQILKKLLAFSIPLILSGLLQQLFSWVDALIVGNIIGEHALAAVGATSSVYGLFITVFVGFTSGLSILFAQQYGQQQPRENARLLVLFASLLATVFTLAAVLGMVFIRPILLLMDTPDALYEDARSYLSIIFAGIPFLAVYNTFSAALRGMGNSRVPFAAVLLSSVLNAVLDYVFIVFLGTGIAGAAAATALSQAAMTLFIIGYTLLRHPELRLLPRREDLSRLLGKGTKYGAPPAIQGSVSSMGNLLLQRFLNSFGQQTVAAISTAYRVDSILFLPLINLSTAISTLVAQETGAGDPEAAKRIFRLGSLLMSVLSLVLTGLILMVGKPLLMLFGLSPQAIAIGTGFFRDIAGFYIICGLSMSLRAYLEGTADLAFSGAAGVCALAVRILCSYLLADLIGNRIIAYAEAISWIFLAAVFALRCRKRSRS